MPNNYEPTSAILRIASSLLLSDVSVFATILEVPVEELTSLGCILDLYALAIDEGEMPQY